MNAPLEAYNSKTYMDAKNFNYPYGVSITDGDEKLFDD